jgi:hypothetical protein
MRVAGRRSRPVRDRKPAGRMGLDPEEGLTTGEALQGQGRAAGRSDGKPEGARSLNRGKKHEPGSLNQ